MGCDVPQDEDEFTAGLCEKCHKHRHIRLPFMSDDEFAEHIRATNNKLVFQQIGEKHADAIDAAPAVAKVYRVIRRTKATLAVSGAKVSFAALHTVPGAGTDAVDVVTYNGRSFYGVAGSVDQDIPESIEIQPVTNVEIELEEVLSDGLLQLVPDQQQIIFSKFAAKTAESLKTPRFTQQQLVDLVATRNSRVGGPVTHPAAPTPFGMSTPPRPSLAATPLSDVWPGASMKPRPSPPRASTRQAATSVDDDMSVSGSASGKGKIKGSGSGKKKTRKEPSIDGATEESSQPLDDVHSKRFRALPDGRRMVVTLAIKALREEMKEVFNVLHTEDWQTRCTSGQVSALRKALDSNHKIAEKHFPEDERLLCGCTSLCDVFLLLACSCKLIFQIVLSLLSLWLLFASYYYT